jgi:hypothetical protein
MGWVDAFQSVVDSLLLSGPHLKAGSILTRVYTFNIKLRSDTPLTGLQERTKSDIHPRAFFLKVYLQTSSISVTRSWLEQSLRPNFYLKTEATL